MNSQREQFEKFVTENWGGPASLERDLLFPEVYDLPSRNWWFKLWQAATEQGVGKPVVTEVKPLSQSAWLAQHGRDFVGGGSIVPPGKPIEGGVPDDTSGTITAFLDILFHAPSSPITTGDAMAIMKWWEKVAE